MATGTLVSKMPIAVAVPLDQYKCASGTLQSTPVSLKHKSARILFPMNPNIIYHFRVSVGAWLARDKILMQQLQMPSDIISPADRLLALSAKVTEGSATYRLLETCNPMVIFHPGNVGGRRITMEKVEVQYL